MRFAEQVMARPVSLPHVSHDFERPSSPPVGKSERLGEMVDED